ncbi:hypothetical protein MFMK1_000590 [Metallumcola ferriviriculae]|uniref:Uncharacterized protein n=1 Tax=Metallumcola ferriviriculae TaxID=3039180 RepID=A0AAU0UIQ0_9FIRM|nr:hypothetical protein MFMK1_000590 [Desulfitibacteraceae bacterium MK1]
MLVSTTTVITLCCPECGKMEHNAVSLFQFAGKNSVPLNCDCGTVLGKLSSRDAKVFLLDFTCGMCTERHGYTFSRNMLWSERATAIFCPDTDLEAGFAGRKEAVRAALREMERSIAQMASELGYDEFFDNPEVMYKILEHLYNIAEKGKLSCHCGNKDVEIEVFPDYVELSCETCQLTETIAALNGDDWHQVESLAELVLAPGGIVRTNMVQLFGPGKK